MWDLLTYGFYVIPNILVCVEHYSTKKSALNTSCKKKFCAQFHIAYIHDMTTLHTFGCSITQGHALPDVIRRLTDAEIAALGRPQHWSDEHILAPSQYAWPQLLGNALGIPVQNHARRGACFQQIAGQCAVAAPSIEPDDLVIVMWTYLDRVSLQWPARTAVPLSHLVDTGVWRTYIRPGFNKLFGLSVSDRSNHDIDERIYTYIHNSSRYTFDPLGIYDRYHNSLVLQTMCDGFLKARGARVIHLSVEPESYLQQLDAARQKLDKTLQEPYVIPNPTEWYNLSVDHDGQSVIHDPSIPTAGQDLHPSVQHHQNFARYVLEQHLT